MSILFLLLKIVLFIIIALIVLLLFLVLLILFVPIKYRVEVETSEACIEVSWLLRIFVFNYNYFIDKNKSDSNLRIFGISLKKNIFSNDSNEAEKTTNNESRDAKKTQLSKKNKQSSNTEYFFEDDIEEVGFLKKAREFYFKIKGIIDYEDRKEITTATLTVIKKIINAIFPKYHKITGVYGFSKASTTGYITALISIVIAFTGLNSELVPIFNKKVFDIKIYLKGKVFLYKLIFSFLSYIFYKPIWKLVKKYFLKLN